MASIIKTSIDLNKIPKDKISEKVEIYVDINLYPK